MEGQQQQDTNMQNLLLELSKGQQEQFKQQEERMRIQREQLDMQRDQLKLLQSGVANVQEDRSGTSVGSPITTAARLMSDLNARLTTFVFDPESDLTFSRWYDRYGEVFTVDGALLDDKSKVRLLVGKLSNEVFDRYKSHILPKTTAGLEFAGTLEILKEMFDVKTSVFTERYNCLKLEKIESEDYMEYTGRVNEQCERGKLQVLDKDGLKALFWISGLKSNRDNDLKTRLLMFLDRRYADKQAVTLRDLYKECDSWLNIKREAKMVQSDSHRVYAVESQLQGQDQVEHIGRLCWNCGKDGHLSRHCKAKKWTCGKCKRSGHKQEFCEQIAKYTANSSGRARVNNSVVVESSEKKLKVNAVRRYLPVDIKGVKIDFQLDTGSDVTLLNVHDWKKLGEPNLEKSKVRVADANGKPIRVLGKLSCDFKMKGEYGTGCAYVSHASSLVGLDWLTQNENMKYYLKMMTGQSEIKDRLKECTNSSLKPQVNEKVMSVVAKVEAKERFNKDGNSSISVSEMSSSQRKWNDRVYVDIVGPVKGLSYLVLEDSETKWTDVAEMKDCTSRTTALTLSEVFKLIGKTPKTIVTSLSTQFVTERFRRECVQNGIRQEQSLFNSESFRFAHVLWQKLKEEKRVPTDDELAEMRENYEDPHSSVEVDNGFVNTNMAMSRC